MSTLSVLVVCFCVLGAFVAGDDTPATTPAVNVEKKTLESSGSALCWNTGADGVLWKSWKATPENMWKSAKLPAPLKDDENDDMRVAATFSPASKQLITVDAPDNDQDPIQELVCGAFFERADEPDGSVSVTRVSVKLAGDLVSALAPANATQFSWMLCREKACTSAERVIVSKNETDLSSTLPGNDGLLSTIQFRLKIVKHPGARVYLINQLKLTVFYDWSETPAPSPGGPSIKVFYDTLRDWSNMSIALIVIASFCCGIVCAGVIYSICRRGKKPIAYDKA